MQVPANPPPQPRRQPGAPLPVPAQAYVTFQDDLFNDASKDPLNGQYQPLYDAFDIDVNNLQATPQPVALRDLIAAAGSQHNPLALGFLNDNKIRVLLCPQRMDQQLGAPVSPVYGKFYAVDGDLHRNQGVTVEVPNALYQLSATQVLVPTLAHILQSLQQDPTLRYFGPYANGDAGTELVRMRKNDSTSIQICFHFLGARTNTTGLFRNSVPTNGH